MKKRWIILIGALGYCIAPDLLTGPMDDGFIVIASALYSILTAGNKDPQYMKMKKDF